MGIGSLIDHMYVYNWTTLISEEVVHGAEDGQIPRFGMNMNMNMIAKLFKSVDAGLRLAANKKCK